MLVKISQVQRNYIGAVSRIMFIFQTPRRIVLTNEIVQRDHLRMKYTSSCHALLQCTAAAAVFPGIVNSIIKGRVKTYR